MTPSGTASTPLMSRIKQRAGRLFGSWGVFFRGFLKHPAMVGSIIPSSPVTVRRMLRTVDWDKCRLFVEYGPGVGTFCQPVLDRMRRDATLVVIDLNPDFVDYLRKTFRDSRFVAVHGSAVDVRAIIGALGFEHADGILSGLPFSTLPRGVGEVLAEETARALRPGGTFLVYQFRARAHAYIAPHFARIDRGYEWLNIPPLFLFWARKGDAPAAAPPPARAEGEPAGSNPGEAGGA